MGNNRHIAKLFDDRSNFYNIDYKNKIKLYPSKANFILIELINNEDSDIANGDLLVRHGVYVRTCSEKIGLENDFIRLASSTFNENKIIYNALSETL